MGWLIASFSALCLATCGHGAPPTAPHNVPLGEEFELAPAQSAVVGDTGLTLAFERVTADSRCAVDVQCVWEGDASVMVVATLPGRDPARLDLHTTTSGGGVREARYGDFLIALARLAPQPHSRTQIEQGAYRATLRVSR